MKNSGLVLFAVADAQLLFQLFLQRNISLNTFLYNKKVFF